MNTHDKHFHHVAETVADTSIVFADYGFRMPLAVAERTIENYQMAFRDPRRKWPDFREFVIPEVDPEPEPEQLSLF